MYVTNRSEVVTNDDLEVILTGIQTQVDRDVLPSWGVHCKLVLRRSAAIVIPPTAMQIEIRDESDEEGALGYHFTENGLPVTYVFAKDDMAGGAGLAGLSTTLSHEVLEMLVDPGVNLYALGPAFISGRWRTATFPYEVCDAVQGNTYEIVLAGGVGRPDFGKVTVSDFVFPEWFEPERRAGEMAMNQTGTLQAPFAIDKGGYASVLYGGKWRDVWGEKRTAKPGRHRQRIRSAESAQIAQLMYTEKHAKAGVRRLAGEQWRDDE